VWVVQQLFPFFYLRKERKVLPLVKLQFRQEVRIKLEIAAKKVFLFVDRHYAKYQAERKAKVIIKNFISLFFSNQISNVSRIKACSYYYFHSCC
jgi:hypothetical protein